MTLSIDEKKAIIKYRIQKLGTVSKKPMIMQG